MRIIGRMADGSICYLGDYTYEVHLRSKDGKDYQEFDDFNSEEDGFAFISSICENKEDSLYLRFKGGTATVECVETDEDSATIFIK